MSTSSLSVPVSPHYRYDSQETIDQFRSRQHQAYAAGRRAWRARRIKAQLLPFYEALVGYVGQNQYAWVKEQTLADEFAVHVATIKRWLSKLEDAELIRRQRRFATSSLTYITAYDAVEDELENTDNLHKLQHDLKDKNDYRQDDPVPIARNHAPTFGADSHPDSINTDHLTVGGSGVTEARNRPVNTAADLLQQEGITDYYLFPAIHDKSFDELQAISSYLDRQRTIRDRPRLFAWLASRDFGVQLLHGRRRREQGNQPAAQQCQHLSRTETHRSTLAQDHDKTPVRGNDDALHMTWQRVLTQLQQALPPAVFITWLADTTLLALDDCAVVGTPHVFARDVLGSEYRLHIQGALQGVLQRAVEVMVVVNRTPPDTPRKRGV